MAQNPPSEDIKDILVTESIGTFGGTTGWGIFIGKQPDPGTVNEQTITLFDTGGQTPEVSVAIDKPTIQILVRGTEWDYKNTHDKCIAIRNVLHRRPTETVNTTVYDGIYQAGDITFIEYQTNRPLFSLNFRMFVEPSATGYRI